MNSYKAKSLFKEQHGEAMVYGNHFDLTKLKAPFEGVCYKNDRKEFYAIDMDTETWVKTGEKIYKK